MEGARHTLFKAGFPVLDDRINIGQNVIHFSSVRKEDVGEYVISSTNGIEEGRGVFNLTVLSKLFNS